MLIRGSAFREIGGFDPSWMYWEDSGLCRRLALRGWKIACEPEAVIHHATSASGTSKRTNPSLPRLCRALCDPVHRTKLVATRSDQDDPSAADPPDPHHHNIEGMTLPAPGARLAAARHRRTGRPFWWDRVRRDPDRTASGTPARHPQAYRRRSPRLDSCHRARGARWVHLIELPEAPYLELPRRLAWEAVPLGRLMRVQRGNLVGNAPPEGAATRSSDGGRETMGRRDFRLTAVCMPPNCGTPRY